MGRILWRFCFCKELQQSWGRAVVSGYLLVGILEEVQGSIQFERSQN